MSMTTAIAFYVAGVGAATLMRPWLLRRGMSEPLATGLVMYVLMLAQHPLSLVTASRMSFTFWATWCALVTVGMVIVYDRILQKK